MLAVGNDSQFKALCGVLAQPAWAQEQRFATNPARVAHRTVLIPLLEQCFRTQPTAFWLAQLSIANVPCSPINDIPTALAEPQAVARGMVQYVDHPVTGRIGLLGPVPKLSRTPAQIRSAPPLLGEHTKSVLQALLGYTDSQIEQLHADGAI